jgi:hypothetical protein
MARRLKSFDDVRRLLASVINRLETKEIDPAIAGRITYTANVLLRALEARDIENMEKRLAALETRGTEK